MSLGKTTNLIGQILFWGWNFLSLFLCVFLLGIAILPFVFMAAINGEIPLSITICLLILIVTPIYAIYFGIKQPRKTVSFFFGVEIPIFILTLFRIFIVRDLTFGSGFLLLSAFVAIGVFAWSLREPEPSRQLNPYVATALSTTVLIAGLYVAVLSGLYAFPLLIEFVKGMFTLDWGREFRYIDGLVILMMGLFLFGALAFFVFPIFIAYFYPKFWAQTGENIRAHISQIKYYITTAGFAALWMGVFAVSSHQGQADYVERLGQMSVAEKQVEMQTPKKVRKRLLKAYLNEYRYLGTRSSSNNLVPLYKEATGSESVGNFAQTTQNLLLNPLLYNGGRRDGFAAGKLYAELFDSSIQRDEKEAITQALEATFNRDDVVAGLMNIGARNVLLREQNINIKANATSSKIEIEEVYENLTFENQEIFYYFSLPEDAAITGIWIGRTDKREDMDAFIVAPRGAAQKVYEQQVRRNIDPALLEQVGPAQYRLRVFPIPVTRARAQFSGRRNINRRNREASLMRVHMQYVVPAGVSEAILPKLLEKRNVDWSRKTKRRLNGNIMKKTRAWMPEFKESLKTELALQTRPPAITIPMNDGAVTLGPIPQTPAEALGHLAVIVDTSYSLRGQEQRLAQTIQDLNALKNDGLASFDVFIGSVEEGSMSKSSSLSPADVKPYGRVTSRDLIEQFLEVAKAENYTAVVLLTDQGNYGTDGQLNTGQLTAPLYVLHIDKAAAAYDDDILDHIYRSGGGVATSVKSLRRQISHNGLNTRVVGDRVWTISSNRNAENFSTSDDMKALAARQTILMNSFGKAPNNRTLDKLHQLATSHDVVTPYSSMIVLVNDRQKEALKRESESNDRFKREGRSGEEALSRPGNPLVSGVPEPHEWLLIILSIVMLFVVWRKREDWELKLA